MASSLTSAEIQELQQLCEWLSNQPCQSAYSGEIIQQFPKLSHWVSVAWKQRRKDAGVFYYHVGYGWRLHRQWRQRLNWLGEKV